MQPFYDRFPENSRRPVIGISANFNDGKAMIMSQYYEQVERAGGVPVLLAPTDDNEVMAVADEKRKVYGLQFHPESIMTPDGKTILKNFLDIAGVLKAA